MLSDNASARDRADHSRETCMLCGNIDLLRCIDYRYHVHNHEVLSFEYNEHELADLLPSRGMHKLHHSKTHLS